MPFGRDLGRSAQGAVSSVEVRDRLPPTAVRERRCALEGCVVSRGGYEGHVVRHSLIELPG